MAFDDPLIDGLSISAVELRRQAAMQLMSDGTAAGARPGVCPGDPSLSVTLAGSTINVSAGVAALYFAGQGVYEVYGTASSPGTVAAAHATLDRIDLVYLRVWDNTVDSSGLAKADTVYLQGTAGSGTAPTPSGTQIYIPLATIAVPHVGAGSPSVTDARPITVAPGGIGVGTLPASGSYAGQLWDDGTGLKRWSGSAWSTVQFGNQIAVTSTDINQRPIQVNAPSGLAAKFLSFNVGATEIGFLNAAGNLTLSGGLTLGGIGQTVTKYKTAITSRASTITIASDPDITFTVVSGAVYAVDGLLVYDGDNTTSAAGDLRIGWTAPGSSTFTWGALGQPATTGSNVGTMITDAQSIASTAYFLGTLGTSLPMLAQVRGLLTAGAAGTFALQWAQGASNATATRMLAGTHVTLRRVA